MTSLGDQVALVTGASRGAGRGMVFKTRMDAFPRH